MNLHKSSWWPFPNTLLGLLLFHHSGFFICRDHDPSICGDNNILSSCFFSIFWDNTAKSLLFYCLYSFAGEIWSSEENFTKTRVLPRKVQQSQSDNSCTQIGGTLLSSPTYYTLCKPSPAGQLLGTRPSSKWLACIIVLFTIYNHFGGGIGTVIL